MKGSDLLTKIMSRLGNQFELSIAGRATTRKIANFGSNVRWLGLLNEENLIRAYQECDALLFPSRTEGFGYAALEAMACGKPVIASEVTALPELIEHNVTGILCPVDDVSSFSSACNHLARNPDLLLKMGNAARNRAIEFFSEERMIDQYMRLILRLVERETAK